MKLVEGFEEWSEVELLAGTIIGEARSEPWNSKVGVGLVVRTRVFDTRWWGRNWREVILANAQFDCWRPTDPNRDWIIKHRAQNDDTWQECMLIAEAVYLNQIDDRYHATHYHADYVTPYWKNDPKMTFLFKHGKHLFYREEK